MKLVADPGTSEAAFSAASAALRVVVSETCQVGVVGALSAEVQALRQRVAEFRKTRASVPPVADDGGRADDALVDRVLARLQERYTDPGLSLTALAEELRCDPRVLMTRFTRTVGERMHAYLLTLRVAHACRLLTGTDLLVKEIAHASGFSVTHRLTGAFRTRIGVSPGEYRRIFSRA